MKEFRNTFTQSDFKSYQGSKQALNTPQKHSYDDLYSETSSLPNTSRHASPRRSKSNENLARNSKFNNNRNIHGSAPHLNNNDSMNNSRNKSQMDIEDFKTDDSDDE